jgi:hypothetical protein
MRRAASRSTRDSFLYYHRIFGRFDRLDLAFIVFIYVALIVEARLERR